jgi:hypothetical protein
VAEPAPGAREAAGWQQLDATGYQIYWLRE